MSNVLKPRTDEQAPATAPRAGDDTEAYIYDWFFGALQRAVKSLSGVPAWPEGTTTYYPRD